jgi:hypothetical protein
VSDLDEFDRAYAEYWEHDPQEDLQDKADHYYELSFFLLFGGAATTLWTASMGRVRDELSDSAIVSVHRSP